MKGEFKVYKSGDFTVMCNYHLKDKTLSLKATGLLSKMLSLPEDWDYSLNGLVAITKDGLDSVRSALNELKEHNYVEILKLRTSKGTFKYNYLVFENPSEKALKLGFNPDMENPHMDSPEVENQRQYNIKEYNIKNKIDKNESIDKTKIKHKALINELIRTGYINEEDEQIIFYDCLFEKYIKNNITYTDLYSAIHYIAPRVINRNFIDEDGNEITNKYGYFKSSVESNFRRFEQPEELWPEDDNDPFWDDYKFMEPEGR